MYGVVPWTNRQQRQRDVPLTDLPMNSFVLAGLSRPAGPRALTEQYFDMPSEAWMSAESEILSPRLPSVWQFRCVIVSRRWQDHLVSPIISN